PAPTWRNLGSGPILDLREAHGPVGPATDGHPLASQQGRTPMSRSRNVWRLCRSRLLFGLAAPVVFAAGLEVAPAADAPVAAPPAPGRGPAGRARRARLPPPRPGAPAGRRRCPGQLRRRRRPRAGDRTAAPAGPRPPHPPPAVPPRRRDRPGGRPPRRGR